MLTESTENDQITIMANGVTLVREVTRVFRDDVEIAKTYRRTSLEPGQYVADQDQRVQDVCSVVWTEKVVSDHRASVEAATSLAMQPQAPQGQGE